MRNVATIGSDVGLAAWMFEWIRLAACQTKLSMAFLVDTFKGFDIGKHDFAPQSIQHYLLLASQLT
jgi:hypothetical protein